MYAFNVADIHKYHADPEYGIMVQCLIKPVLDVDPTANLVECEKALDGMGVMVREDVSEERMQALLELVRNGAGHRAGIHKNLLRIYYSKTGKGGWKRV